MWNWNCQECDTDDDGHVKNPRTIHGCEPTDDAAEQAAQTHADRRHGGETWLTLWPANEEM